MKVKLGKNKALCFHINGTQAQKQTVKIINSFTHSDAKYYRQ